MALHSPPKRSVVGAHRAMRLTTWRGWTCWATWRAWIVQGGVWEGLMVQPSPFEDVPHTGLKAAGDPPYLGHPHEVAAAGGPSRPHRHAMAPAAPARLPTRQRARSRCAEGVATRGFGRRREGEVHGPSAGPRNLTGSWVDGYAPPTRGGLRTSPSTPPAARRCQPHQLLRRWRWG